MCYCFINASLGSDIRVAVNGKINFLFFTFSNQYACSFFFFILLSSIFALHLFFHSLFCSTHRVFVSFYHLPCSNYSLTFFRFVFYFLSPPYPLPHSPQSTHPSMCIISFILHLLLTCCVLTYFLSCPPSHHSILYYPTWFLPCIIISSEMRCKGPEIMWTAITCKINLKKCLNIQTPKCAPHHTAAHTHIHMFKPSDRL